MKNKKREVKKNIPSYKLVFAWIIAVFAAVFPWFTHLRVWKLTEAEADVFENYNGYIFDFFLYYRELFLILTALILLVVMVGENIFPDTVIKETPLRAKGSRKVLICLGIYTAAVVLSFLFSKNKGLALWGSPSEGEGIFVLTGYVILFMGAMNYFCYESALRVFEKVMILLCVVTILLTAVEFFYEPVLKLPFLAKWIAPEKYAALIENLNTENYKSYVSLTFYNPNYFGGFCLLLLPFPVELLLRETDWKKMAGYIILTVGMLFSVTAAKSSTSFYLAFAELVFLCALEGHRLGSRWKKLAVLCVAGGVGFVLLNAASNGRLLMIGANALSNEGTANQKEQIFYLEDINISGNELLLKGMTAELVTVCDGGVLQFYDGERNPVECGQQENTFTFSDERYRGITVSYSQDMVYYDLGYDEPVDFSLQDDMFYGIGQNGVLLTEVTLKNRFGEKLYPLFTGRGYAWVNTLPLLTKTVLAGRGAGNFALYFPQNDYVGLMNTHGTHELVIDKPHNIYLQTAVNTGLIGLAALLAVLVLTAVRFIRYRNTQDTVFSKTADWTFVAAAAFAVYGIFNDSIVTVTPLFWVLLGVQFAVIYTFQNGKEKEV